MHQHCCDLSPHNDPLAVRLLEGQVGQEPKHVHLELIQAPFNGHRVDRLLCLGVVRAGVKEDPRAVHGVA